LDILFGLTHRYYGVEPLAVTPVIQGDIEGHQAQTLTSVR
jgi:hypothetical protein